jgi:hypothetical protein
MPFPGFALLMKVVQMQQVTCRSTAIVVRGGNRGLFDVVIDS